MVSNEQDGKFATPKLRAQTARGRDARAQQVAVQDPDAQLTESVVLARTPASFRKLCGALNFFSEKSRERILCRRHGLASDRICRISTLALSLSSVICSPALLSTVHCALITMPPPHSYLSASIGSRFAARIAGIIPLTSPVIIRIAVATTTEVGEISSWISAFSACFASSL